MKIEGYKKETGETGGVEMTEVRGKFEVRYYSPNCKNTVTATFTEFWEAFNFFKSKAFDLKMETDKLSLAE